MFETWMKQLGVWCKIGLIGVIQSGLWKRRIPGLGTNVSCLKMTFKVSVLLNSRLFGGWFMTEVWFCNFGSFCSFPKARARSVSYGGWMVIGISLLGHNKHEQMV